MDDKILELLVEMCGTDEVREDRDLELFENGLLDSLALIELILGIEEKLGLKIEPTEVERKEFDTPNKIIEYVSKRL